MRNEEAPSDTSAGGGATDNSTGDLGSLRDKRETLLSDEEVVSCGGRRSLHLRRQLVFPLPWTLPLGRNPVFWTSIVALCACVGCMAMAAFAVCQYEKAVSELRIARENRGKICLSCDATASVVDSWKSDRSGECCVQLEDLLGIMKTVASNEVELRLKKVANSVPSMSLRESGNATGMPSIKPLAHLVGMGQQSTPLTGVASDMDGMAIEWDVSSRSSHIAFPLVYRHGKLIIPANGFYLVYSQVNTAEVYGTAEGSREMSGSSRGGSSIGGSASGHQSLSHSLWRRRSRRGTSAGGHEVLARSRQSKCWSSERPYDIEVSYLGAVFFLEKDDEVYVKVSNSSLLHDDRVASFFGVVAL